MLRFINYSDNSLFFCDSENFTNFWPWSDNFSNMNSFTGIFPAPTLLTPAAPIKFLKSPSPSCIWHLWETWAGRYCLSCLVLAVFIKWWNSLKVFVLHEYAVFLPFFFSQISVICSATWLSFQIYQKLVWLKQS